MRVIIHLQVVLIAALLAGCATHHRHVDVQEVEGSRRYIDHVNEGTTAGTRVVTPATQERLDRVGFLEPGLERSIAVERTVPSRTATNTVEVATTLRNRTDYPQSVKLRIQFLGPDRQSLEGPGAWQQLHLPPNGIETVRFTSTRADVSHYYIEAAALR